MDLLGTRQVDPVHQSPQTRMYGFFTHGTVPPSRLYSSGLLSLPDIFAGCPSPTQFRRRLPGHVVFPTLHRYYSAVRLLTDHHSPLPSSFYSPLPRSPPRTLPVLLPSRLSL